MVFLSRLIPSNHQAIRELPKREGATSHFPRLVGYLFLLFYGVKAERRPCMGQSSEGRTQAYGPIVKKQKTNMGKALNSLMVRGYEPGGEDYEFNPRSGNFFLPYGKRGEE